MQCIKVSLKLDDTTGENFNYPTKVLMKIIMSGGNDLFRVYLRSAYFVETENFLLKILQIKVKGS